MRQRAEGLRHLKLSRCNRFAWGLRIATEKSGEENKGPRDPSKRMAEENQQNLATGADADPDATLVRPFFNEESAEAARPVVPLSAEAVAASDAREENFSPLAPPGAVYASRLRPRAGWPVALVLVSALFGALVGVFALRFYQTRAVADEVMPQAAAAEQQQTTTQPAAEAPQPAPPAEEQVAASEPIEQPVAEQTEPEEAAGEEVEAPSDEAEAEAARPAAAPRRNSEESRPATAAPAVEREDTSGSRRRGKRGEDDDDAQATKPRRVARAAERPREEAGNGRPQPRLVDVITGEPERRRQRRRERRGGQRDSLRAIFEGQPPG